MSVSVGVGVGDDVGKGEGVSAKMSVGMGVSVGVSVDVRICLAILRRCDYAGCLLLSCRREVHGFLSRYLQTSEGAVWKNEPTESSLITFQVRLVGVAAMCQ